jgi:hypothetical protein
MSPYPSGKAPAAGPSQKKNPKDSQKDTKTGKSVSGKSAAVKETDELYDKNEPLQAALRELVTYGGSLEYLTSRITLQLLRIHFSPDVWSIVAEYYTEEKKKPDYVVEKIKGGMIIPHIFVECKSKKGDSFNKAVDQLTEASRITSDEKSECQSLWFIVTRNDKIGFYLYSNDRCNLEEDGIPNYNGAIPVNQLKLIKEKFNLRLGVELPDWLDYKGKGNFPVENKSPSEKGAIGHWLSIRDDAPMVRKLMDWIRDTDPIDLSEQEIPKEGYTKNPELVEKEDLDPDLDQDLDQDPLTLDLQKLVLYTPRKAGQRLPGTEPVPMPSTPTPGKKREI